MRKIIFVLLAFVVFTSCDSNSVPKIGSVDHPFRIVKIEVYDVNSDFSVYFGTYNASGTKTWDEPA